MLLGGSSYTRGPPSSALSGASATNASWIAARSAAEAAVGMGDFLEKLRERAGQSTRSCASISTKRPLPS